MAKVSVIMPAYNSGKYIGEAIDSLIAQTFEDWELVVINDGSKDNTASVVRGFDDKRIKFIDHKNNYGFIPTLNYAIAISSGEYIARLDDDDINYPERFEKQVAFLEQHKDVLLVGGVLDVLQDGKIYSHQVRPFETAEELKFCLLFGNLSFGHSSFMFRRSVFDEYKIKYDTFLQVPDHHIQLDVCQKGKLGIIREKVYIYRMHSTQSTAVRSLEMQQTEEDKCRCMYIDEIGLSEEDKLVLKKGVCRELKTLSDFRLFSSAVIRYGILCGMPQEKKLIKDSRAYAYVYDYIFKMQMNSIWALLGYMMSPFKKSLTLKKILCLVAHRNKGYIHPMVDYRQKFERVIYPDILGE